MKQLLSGTAVLLAMAMPASAASVLVGSSDGTIAEVDTSNGAVSNSFDTGTQNWFDIAVDNDGNAFGVDLGSTTWSIDLGTQSATSLGATGAFINGLAFGAGNTLYGSGDNNLYTIDTVSGGATVVGTGVGGNFFSSGDIAFAGGSFFGTSSNSCGGIGGDCLWSIDATSGVGTAIGDIGVSSVFGLALTGGTLFGLSSDDNIYTINTSTGAGTLATGFTLSGATNGAAVPPSAVIPVPAALPLLATALFGLGWVGRRRRNVA